MALRYSKVLRRIFKDILEMQRIGQLDAATDEKLREYLHTHRKALRELQRAEDKRRWDVLRRATKPISDEALQAYLEKRWPHTYKEELRTLLFEHGTEAYKKLVQSAKIGPLF